MNISSKKLKFSNFFQFYPAQNIQKILVVISQFTHFSQRFR